MGILLLSKIIQKVFGIFAFIFINLTALLTFGYDLDKLNPSPNTKFDYEREFILQGPIEWRSLHYFINVTPKRILDRPKDFPTYPELIQSRADVVLKSVKPITDAEAIELYDYMSQEQLFEKDLNQLERFLKKRAGSDKRINNYALEFELNMYYAFQLLRAHDINTGSETNYAFLAAIEYLKRRKYTEISVVKNYIFQDLLYKTQNTSDKNTVKKLIHTLSALDRFTFLSFITNGSRGGNFSRATYLAPLIELMYKYDYFYQAPDAQETFKVIKDSIDYLYSQITADNEKRIRDEIHSIANQASQYFHKRGELPMAKYFKNTYIRENTILERFIELEKAKKNADNKDSTRNQFLYAIGQYLLNFRLGETAKLTLEDTVIEIRVKRHTVLEINGNIVQLSVAKQEKFFEIKTEQKGPIADEVLTSTVDYLLKNKIGAGVYFSSPANVPRSLNLSKYRTSSTKNGGLFVRSQELWAPLLCEQLFAF